MLDASNPAFRPVLDRFHVRMRENRTRLDDLRASISAGDEQAFAEIRLIAHRLAGAAGTFGYAALGGAARELDVVLSEGCRNAGLVDDRLLALIAAIDASGSAAA
ncbi:hypothetical protein A33M_3668 [Rhodovulum sp. PH10]|uniref:Hpt domain-containing protein n=1 Tax=Rhodovulum sp. PH10 TaxID=1187851 RepID=UPI00027C2E1F|nr:Hpt domain-containing protein [Rhodovulum sp. PH10]EJW10927.1 hypothetical protein A33M_3668 [Rhodovulum sp. PH10]